MGAGPGSNRSQTDNELSLSPYQAARRNPSEVVGIADLWDFLVIWLEKINLSCKISCGDVATGAWCDTHGSLHGHFGVNPKRPENGAVAA